MKDMSNNNKHYHIMTSCDEELISYIPVQMYAISSTLYDATIEFYLFYREISDDNIQMLEAFCDFLKNISFHAIKVQKAEKYDALARSGGGWSGEAYFSLCAHQYLPEHVERVLYIDAGDVMIISDIAPYYYCDFEGKALIVTPGKYKTIQSGNVPYEETDLKDINGHFIDICRGIFNSGSYVINLAKMRSEQLTIDDYVDLVESLCELSGKEKGTRLYWGDQGLLSAAFVGDVKLFGYPESKSIWNMPYNFCLWFYDKIKDIPPYRPAVIHYTGAFKPWKCRYPIMLNRYCKDADRTIQELKLGQAEWYYLWHEYAICTDSILNSMNL